MKKNCCSSPPWMHLAVVSVAIALGIGCGDSYGSGDTTPPCDVGWGELAITEIMSNPFGPDAGSEWFEVVNLSGRHLALTGLTLIVGTPSRPRTHRVLEELDPGLAPGDYVTFGNGIHGELAAGYAWPQMNLANQGAIIEIRCEDQVIDRVVYGQNAVLPPPEGSAIQLSAAILEDLEAIPAESNDAADAWCAVDPQEPPYDDTGNRGTPGTSNGRCLVPGQCLDTDGFRPVSTPSPGDATFSEIYADTPGTDDPMAEWVEIRVHRGFDLAGLVMDHATATGTRSFTIPETACLALATGTFAVLGATDDPARNGDVNGMIAAFPSGLNLYNGAATLTLRTAGGIEIARSEHPAARPGVTVGVDPDSSVWCVQRMAGLFEGTGTPGTDNDTCEANQ